MRAKVPLTLIAVGFGLLVLGFVLWTTVNHLCADPPYCLWRWNTIRHGKFLVGAGIGLVSTPLVWMFIGRRR
jgi:hypothetical protein